MSLGSQCMRLSVCKQLSDVILKARIPKEWLLSNTYLLPLKLEPMKHPSRASFGTVAGFQYTTNCSGVNTGILQTTCLSNPACWICYQSFHNGTQCCSRGSVAEVQERAIGVTKAAQQRLLRKRLKYSFQPKVLKVAVIGAPNAGKSTLANRLLGWRFAAVSGKVHTTRHNAVGVLTDRDTQLVFLDTPGLTTPEKVKRHRLEKTLLMDPHSSLADANLILLVVDVSKIWNRSRLETDILTILELHKEKKTVLVLNKVDELRVKRDLLTTARVLTDGIIGGRPIKMSKSRGVRARDIVDVQAMMDKMTGRTRPSKETTLQPENKRLTQSLNHVDAVSDNGPYQTSGELVSDHVNASRSNDHHGDDQPVDGPYQTSDELDSNDASASRSNAHHGDEQSVDGGEIKMAAVGEMLSEEEWRVYSSRLRAARAGVVDKVGWPGFDEVFMLSALDGDGCSELKDYLLGAAVPGSWPYSPDAVTDQDPVELAVMCIRERLLDNLPAEIPYLIDIRMTVWEVDESDYLRAVFKLQCSDKRHVSHLLRHKGECIKKISAEAKQQLMDTFRREVSLMLEVSTVSTHKRG